MEIYDIFAIQNIFADWNTSIKYHLWYARCHNSSDDFLSYSHTAAFNYSPMRQTHMASSSENSRAMHENESQISYFLNRIDSRWCGGVNRMLLGCDLWKILMIAGQRMSVTAESQIKCMFKFNLKSNYVLDPKHNWGHIHVSVKFCFVKYDNFIS